MSEDPRFRELEEEIAVLRRQICDLGDRSTLERLSRQPKPSPRTVTRSILDDELPLAEKTAHLCCECLDNGDLDAAFLSILRYIEAIAQGKADSQEISERATREHVERRLDTVISINTDRMSVATGRLHDRIEARVRSISNEFDEFSNNITSRMDLAHSRLTTFEETIATKSGKVSVTRKSISNQGGFFDISSRTRHSLRIRKDGIVYPPKAIIPVEPGAEALMPAVTTVSVRDPTPRSLLV